MVNLADSMSGEGFVIKRMETFIVAWEKAGDRRAIFLSCYAMMTRNILSAIQAGDFEDNAWVYKLLQRFAEYYFTALEAYERTQRASLVWQLAFDAARLPHIHVLQNLVLGVNAHINFDLVYTLEDVLVSEWSQLTQEQRSSRYRDHCHVNEVIYQTIDSVQDQVIERYEPIMDQVDRLMGSLDEWITSRFITDWREEVWENVTRLLQSSDESEREFLLQEVEQRSVRRAYSLLGEDGFLGIINLI